jgi:hypothetical protein
MALARRVPIPNTRPEVSVTVPIGWEVNTYVHPSSAYLAMLPKRQPDDSRPMFPELTIVEEVAVDPEGSLLSVLAAMGRLAKAEDIIHGHGANGFEFVTWSVTSELEVDFIDGTGSELPLKTLTTAVLVGGRIFICSIQRHADKKASPSSDSELVSNTCSSIRPSAVPRPSVGNVARDSRHL